jgi:hypothetical protein
VVDWARSQVIAGCVEELADVVGHVAAHAPMMAVPGEQGTTRFVPGTGRHGDQFQGQKRPRAMSLRSPPHLNG